jgi:hypothetical protein
MGRPAPNTTCSGTHQQDTANVIDDNNCLTAPMVVGGVLQ